MVVATCTFFGARCHDHDIPSQHPARQRCQPCDVRGGWGGQGLTVQRRPASSTSPCQQVDQGLGGLGEVAAVEAEGDVVRYTGASDLAEVGGVESEQERGAGGAVEHD